MQERMKTILKDLVCPFCHTSLAINDEVVYCQKCQRVYPQAENAILFTPIPENIMPSEARERGVGKDTTWRQANTDFLRTQLQKLSKECLILDVGAGRGDFLPYYGEFPHILLDVYPYPPVDIVCDLSQLIPLRDSCLDIVLLMNVLEHVPSPLYLLCSIRSLLKSHGKVFITIPFYLKIHQAPLDFQRLTHFALRNLAEKAGYSICFLEGFYDPVGVIQESLRYYQFWGMEGSGRLKRTFERGVLGGMQFFSKMLGKATKRSYLKDPFQAAYPAPIGYHLVLEKN